MFRHKALKTINEIRVGLGLRNKIANANGYTTLGISRRSQAPALREWLNSLGWTQEHPRNRPYPQANGLNNEGFVCGWCQVQARADKGKFPCARIYGSITLLNEINELVSRQTGLPIMKPKQARMLHYKGLSATILGRWLDGLKRNGLRYKKPDGYLTIEAAARKYNLSPVALFARARAGKIKEAQRISNFWYIPDVEPTEENGLIQIEPDYVTLAEAARRLNLTRDQVDWLRDTGKIPDLKRAAGFFCVVPVEWVEAYKKEIQLPQGNHITIAETAEILGVSRTTVVKIRDKGKIDGAVCIRRHWHIPLKWVKEERVRREKKRLVKALKTAERGD